MVFAAVEGKTPPQSQQTQAKEDSEEELECAVCLQKCVHPVRLPCTHIFCFLCVKVRQGRTRAGDTARLWHR